MLSVHIKYTNFNIRKTRVIGGIIGVVVSSNTNVKNLRPQVQRPNLKVGININKKLSNPMYSKYINNVTP